MPSLKNNYTCMFGSEYGEIISVGYTELVCKSPNSTNEGHVPLQILYNEDTWANATFNYYSTLSNCESK